MLNNLLKIVKQKSNIDQRQSWYKGHETYFQGLKDEVLEVEEELKDHNNIYLEDELGDILWNYLHVLESLSKEGKISSMENVLARAEIKYSQRVGAIAVKGDEEKQESWDEVKNRQKKELAEEHRKKYH